MEVKNADGKTAHTEGPWEIVDNEIHAGRIHVVCFGHDYDDLGCFSGPNAEANARLIAAALELLSALQNAVEILRIELHSENRRSDAFMRLDEARTAIAKATGSRP